jgi:hypothetical protein
MKEKAANKKRGGKRPGAGRKPAQIPMIPVTIYVSKPDVQAWGGKVALRDKLAALVACTKIPSDVFSAKVVNPVTPKQSVALHNAENKDQMTEVFPMRQLHNGEILKQIGEIEAEKIPKERDTAFGRRAWQLDQQKRIDKLKSQLK